MEDKALSNSEKMEELEGLLIDEIIKTLKRGGDSDIERSEKICGMIVSLLNAKANLVKSYSEV
jgi:hypothetical protein